jgi:hypothetical protein
MDAHTHPLSWQIELPSKRMGPMACGEMYCGLGACHDALSCCSQIVPSRIWISSALYFEVSYNGMQWPGQLRDASSIPLVPYRNLITATDGVHSCGRKSWTLTDSAIAGSI